MTNLEARVDVDLGSRSYSILIGSAVIEAPESYVGLLAAEACLIVSNETVATLYADRLCSALRSRYNVVRTLSLPDGEAFKDLATLQRIFDELLAAGCDRRTTLYALGGGVIGDLTGFAAACYMRGVPYVQVPTTLLAQVDSSVGGKTAVNHPLGKNMIGAFHQPLRVIADVDVLDSLPPREWLAGLAEVIKYGAIADDDFLGWIEANLPKLLARNKPAVVAAVKRSCEIKAEIVGQDEREGGLRAVLNLGHTFGHAIEAGVGYGQWLHGEAVGCGMAMAADLSARMGLVQAAYAERILHIVKAAGLPTKAPVLGLDRYIALMRGDKKAVAGDLRFVLLTGPGRATVAAAPIELVRRTLERFGDAAPDSAPQ